MNLSGRVAVVTGGASGIGRATAVTLARHGARVFVGDIQPQSENDPVFDELEITQHVCDVTTTDDVRRLMNLAAGTGGAVNILVNSAGINMPGQVTEVTEQQWDACLNTNLKGTFLASKYAIYSMTSHGGGTIVNISSNAGILTRAQDPVYSISKAAVIALTKSLALCHADDKIRVNAICPGPVEETRMMDEALQSAADPKAARQSTIDASPLARAMGRMIAPAEIAEAALYLVSDAAVMVTGTVVGIDGGKSLGVAR